MTKPLVSIVVPIFNGESYILETLESISTQSFSNWECVLINDGSTDNSRQVVEDWISQSPMASKFRLFSVKNQGVSQARNLGLDLVKAETVAFLDCDDIWEPNKLEMQYAILSSRPDVMGVVSSFFVARKNKQKVLKNFRLVHHKQIPKLLKGWISLTGNGALVSSGLLMRSNSLRFDLNLATTADLVFFVRLSCLGTIKILTNPLIRYRIHGEQMHLSPEILIAEFPTFIEKLGGHTYGNRPRKMLGNAYAMAALLALSKGRFQYASSLFRISGGHSSTSPIQVILSVFYKRVSGILRFKIFCFQEFIKKLD